MQNTRKKPGDTWENHVEMQIREAMERGDFDNLKGKGKPLDLTSRAADPALEMANKIVRDAGFAPAWLELEHEIDIEQKKAEDALMRTWRWCEAARGDAIEDPLWLAAEWRTARDAFEKQLRQINDRILSLNLQLPEPLLHRQRPRLRLDTEFERLGIAER
ncbi:MAG: DUF1992 domain-containing protein [Chloroflexi bacterium]|nr:DUF1992 domain-containing protein [Chloroflexota bacterium]